MTTNKTTPDIEKSSGFDCHAELAAGLAELKSLAVRYGPRAGQRQRTRVQLFLTPVEHMSLAAIRHTASAIVGRPVKASLLMRLALKRLLIDCQKALVDPAIAEKLKAELLKVREERRGEP